MLFVGEHVVDIVKLHRDAQFKCVNHDFGRGAAFERVERGEQCMLLLNRRGYAPVLHCADCGWKSECKHCSAFRVFHKIDRTLRCHHCGLTERVPRACPECGNATLIRKDGCDWCSACGYTGTCG
jgi:primosomal protein N'